MRILVISYSYLPHNSPRSLRWSALLENWTRAGHQVEVISGFDQDGAVEFERNGVRVFTPNGGERSLRRMREQHGRFFNALRSVYRLTWRQLQWPDYASLWMHPAQRLAEERIASFNPDILLTVSHPFSGHMVGHALKQKFQDLPWYVDIGDPFSFLEFVQINNPWLFSGRNRRVEQRIMHLCQGASVTTEGTKSKYVEWDSTFAEKIRVMAPLLRGGMEDFFSPSEVNASVPHEWLYLGTLYRGIRSPKAVLELFSTWAEQFPADPFVLHFVGHNSDCQDLLSSYANRLGNRLRVQGPVSEAQSREFLRRAQGLINIGNRTSFQLPSKVVEYAATGKWILNFHSIEEDSSVPFFAAYPGLLSVGPQADFTELARRLHAELPNLENHREQVRKIVAPCTLTSISDQYLNHLRSLKR